MMATTSQYETIRKLLAVAECPTATEAERETAQRKAIRYHHLVRDNEQGDRLPRFAWRCSCGSHVWQDVSRYECRETRRTIKALDHPEAIDECDPRCHEAGRCLFPDYSGDYCDPAYHGEAPSDSGT